MASKTCQPQRTILSLWMSSQVDLHNVFSGPSCISKGRLLSLLLFQCDPSSRLRVSGIRGVTKALRHLWCRICWRIPPWLLHLHRPPPLQQLELFFGNFQVQATNGRMTGNECFCCVVRRNLGYIICAIIERLPRQWNVGHLRPFSLIVSTGLFAEDVAELSWVWEFQNLACALPTQMALLWELWPAQFIHGKLYDCQTSHIRKHSYY